MLGTFYPRFPESAPSRDQDAGFRFGRDAKLVKNFYGVKTIVLIAAEFVESVEDEGQIAFP